MRHAAFLAVALLATPAAADEVATGHNLLPHCQAAHQNLHGRAENPKDDMFMQGVCLGEIYATSRMLAAQGRACVPTTMPLRDQLRSVVAYLNLRPEDLQKDFVDLVRDMMLSMWPCQQRRMIQQ